MNEEELKKAFMDAGQAQVFRFWDELGSDKQQQLIGQANEIDLAEVDRLNRELVHPQAHQSLNLGGLMPAPFIKQPKHGGDASVWSEARKTGESALKQGRVACFTVAGGQGTRLGYDGPKGTFPVTPIKNKTLFQVFAEKILFASSHYDHDIPWFIMTSHANHEPTVSFFETNNFFGLEKSNVIFFRQGRMPAVDPSGKIMLAGKHEIAMNPDGHGGSLRALVRSGAIDILKERGIDIISYFQVDNPLVQCIDPAFIGFHIEHQSEMSSKMIPKAFAGEKVGHFCLLNEKMVVIEYSDMPDSLQKKINNSGELTYIAGNVAIHIIARDFIERVGSNDADCRLPFHRADKKIKTMDEAGEPIFPDKPNGIKFELFVFDALPFAANPVVIETFREDDFSPVKNAQGLDSPRSCREDQMRQWNRWLEAAGERITVDETGLPEKLLEVSPLFAVDQSSFTENWLKLSKKLSIESAIYIE